MLFPSVIQKPALEPVTETIFTCFVTFTPVQVNCGLAVDELLTCFPETVYSV